MLLKNDSYQPWNIPLESVQKNIPLQENTQSDTS